MTDIKEAVREAFERIVKAPPYERDTEKYPNDASVSAWPNAYRDYKLQFAYDVLCDYLTEIENDYDRRGR